MYLSEYGYVVYRLDWDRWLMMALIGITIGIVGFLLHQAVHLIGHWKWHKANEYLHQVINPIKLFKYIIM